MGSKTADIRIGGGAHLRASDRAFLLGQKPKSHATGQYLAYFTVSLTIPLAPQLLLISASAPIPLLARSRVRCLYPAPESPHVEDASVHERCRSSCPTELLPAP